MLATEQPAFTWAAEKRPNTFVVGAPKCGTTALCSYLGQHPEVFVSNPKEPHYFVGHEMPAKARVFAEEERYAKLFDKVDDNKVICEGSVWYLFSKTALRRIKEFNADSNIIVMLRRPDEMVYSMHNMAVVNFSEDILDFDVAWRTALDGNQRKSWSKLCDERSKLDYHKIALYSEQLSRVYEHFPPEQVHIVFYDDFRQDTRRSFFQVLDFLSLGHSEVNLEKVNESQIVNNRTVGRFLRKPPATIMKSSRIVKRLLGIKKLGVRDKFESMNRQVSARKPLNPETREEIINHYREDINKLSILCDRDLAKWLK